MNKLTLFFMLRRNMKLSNKRHPMFEQNKVAIIFTIFGVAFMSIYLIVLGTFLGWGARGGDEGLIFAVLPMFLFLDFFMRFGGQQLPSLLIKPYLLMPIRRSDITDCFIVMSMLSSFNLLWLLLLVPFFFIVCCGGLPFSTTMGMLIGHRGETLDAMQYLTSLAVNRNRKQDGYTRISIDTEGYREKREETLARLARKIANQVKATGRPRTLEPMNPYERRVLHATLQNNPYVATRSEGEEPNRRVVIFPKGSEE